MTGAGAGVRDSAKPTYGKGQSDNSAMARQGTGKGPTDT